VSEPRGGATDDARPDPRPAPSKRALWLTIAPLVILTIFANVGAAFRPRLIANHPLILLMADPKNLNIVLVTAKVSFAALLVVVVIRRLLANPFYYLLGYWYGDAAIRWLEKRSPELGTLATTIERWFPRWGVLIVLVYSHPLVVVMAGASEMKLIAFMIYDFIGTTASVLLLRQFGVRFDSAINPVTGFITRYSIPLTVLSFVLVAYYLWDGQRKGKSKIGSVGDIERELEHERTEQRSDQTPDEN